MQGARTSRLAELLREVLAEEIAKLKDPRLELVTITGVDVGEDLTLATVYFDVLGDARRVESAGTALGAAGGRLRAAAGRQLRLKRIPRIRFAPDPAVAEGERVDAILGELAVSTGEQVPGERAGGGRPAVQNDGSALKRPEDD